MRIYTYFLFLLLVLASLTSCVENIDFKQAENLELQPKYIASLVYFKIPVDGFLDSANNEITTPIIDETKLDVLDEEIFQKYLTEVVLDVEIKNPFGRNIQVEVVFLDEAEVITYQISPIIIPANTTKFTYQETISIASNPGFLNSRKVRAFIQIMSNTGTAIDPNSISDFEFKSAGTFSFKI